MIDAPLFAPAVNATVTLLSPPVTEFRVGAAGAEAEEYLIKFEPTTAQNPFVTALIPLGALAGVIVVVIVDVAISKPNIRVGKEKDINSVVPSELMDLNEWVLGLKSFKVIVVTALSTKEIRTNLSACPVLPLNTHT